MRVIMSHMGGEKPITLDYASAPAALPPPNDAIGLPQPPRTELLNRPARLAALVAVLIPWVWGLWIRALAPYSIWFVVAGSAATLLLAVLSGVLAVRAIAALHYAGRAGPVIVAMGVVLLADLFFALCGVMMILFPFRIAG